MILIKLGTDKLFSAIESINLLKSVQNKTKQHESVQPI
jgi:hypothetical protein